MNGNTSKEDILFLDIETVPLYADYNKAPVEAQGLFELKTSYKRGDDISVEDFYDSAGIWAEFGKVACISVGYFKNKKLRITSLYHAKEKDLLLAFANLLTTYFNSPNTCLCGHNAKEFDFPFIARRMLVNGVALPSHLNLMGKKPWEIKHLDTMEMWRFGDYKHYTSLKLLCYVLQVPSPKGDIDGSKVGGVYYKENDLLRIVRYCEQDVLALTRVYLKLIGEGNLLEEDVVFVKGAC